MNKPNYNIITPFKRWTIQNFPFIEEDFDAITNYQLLCKIVEYLNKVIENEKLLEQSNNELIDAFNNLKSYVDNYFENLDVQDEINNKLDKMAESGQLTDIIAQYLGLAGVLAFNTIDDLADALNITDGSICYCLGDNAYNDIKGAFYKIRTVTSSDVVDGFNIVALDVSETLIAERVSNIESYYKEITYNYSRTNNTNYYEINIPFNDSNNNEIPFELVRANPNTSPIENSHYHNSNFMCNASLSVYNGETYIEGIIIINGTVLNDTDVSAYCTNEKYIGIKANRELAIYDNDVTSSEMLEDGVISACLCFGKCVNNGVIDPDFSFQTVKGPDIFVGQKSNKDIIVIACDGRNNNNEGMNYTQMSTILINQGCIDVYALDGGGSTSLIYRGNKLNMNVDDGGIKDRKIACLFNVSKPIINKEITDIYNFIGNMKHLLNYQLRPLINNKENKHGYLKMNLAGSIHNDPDKPIIPFTLSAPSTDFITVETDVNGGTHFKFKEYGILKYSYKFLVQATGNGNLYFRTLLNDVNNEPDQVSYAITSGQVFTTSNSGIFRVNYNEITDFALALQANTANNICNILNGNITLEFVPINDENYI